MTGTADTEAVEFKKIYNLDVVVIPSNRTVIRKDQDDGVYRTAREKFVAISEEIAKAKEKNQPVLVGTVSVEKSELLSKLLQKKGVEHEVLNAKNHAREAEIIKNAGQKGSVTISTNMAGRGTDIILGEGVAELGGLYVIGTERHESRRVDNQLRGRSGRQGDAGETRFFLSLEDDLMRIFASDRLSMIMGRLGMKEGEAIVAPMVTRAIERAQKRVEEQNFSSRKHLLEYDDVMNQQRQIIYSRRKMILEGQVNFEFFNPVVLSVADRIIAKHSNSEEKVSKSKDIASQKLDASTNFPAMIAELEAEFHTPLEKLKTSNLAAKSLQQISDECAAELEEIYKKKMSTVPEELRKQVESFIYLQVIDSAWKDHLQAMDTLKDSVSLRSYGQRDPLQEYKKEAFRLFEQMIGRMEDDTILTLLRMSPPTISGVEELQSEEIDEDELNFAHPQAQKPTPTLSSPKESGVAPNSPDSNAKEELIYYGRNPQQGQQARSQQAIQPIQRQEPKVGRNDPCPCGSGKKFKKCHGVNSDSPEGAYS